MRYIKMLMLAVIMLPITVFAEQKAKNTDPYPNFDLKEAVGFWQQWRDKKPFTQAEYHRVMEMCNIAFDYLIADFENVAANVSEPKKRTEAFRNIVDIGKSSDMNQFCRSFSTRMRSIALDQGFDDENMELYRDMQRIKKVYKARVDELEHPECVAIPPMPTAPVDSVGPDQASIN